MGRGQTHKHTYGHRDSMIESAQWADSMKTSLVHLHHFLTIFTIMRVLLIIATYIMFLIAMRRIIKRIRIRMKMRTTFHFWGWMMVPGKFS